MFARVIPLTKLPRGLNYFDYSVPQELQTKIKIGHMVAIYFRGKEIYGLVAGLILEPRIEIKKIKPINALTGIVLPKTLLRIAAWASDNYLVSPSLLHKLIIPSPAKKKSAADYAPKKILSLNKSETAEVIKILSSFAADKYKFFLYEHNFKEILAAFIKIAQKKLAQKKQILILAPTLEDINNFAPYLNAVFGGQLIIWHGKMSKSERFSKWLAILSGRAVLILGTRPACFLPFKNLSSILIYNCASPDLKQQDRNPRYDSRRVAEELQKIHQAQIVFSDIFPDLKIFKEISEGKISAVNEAAPVPVFEIIDIRKEKKSAPFFSFPLYKMIDEGLGKKQKIILFANRREKNSLLFCNDCHKIFFCPECGRPFNVDNKQFLCYHCKIQNPLPLICPDCKGANMKILSAGAENIKKIINKEFPEARIEIAAKNKSAAPNFDILITTDYFWKNILPQIKDAAIYGAAIIYFDFYLAKPEFNRTETALLALQRFLNFAENYKLKRVLAQTAFPENAVFSQPEAVYNKELEERHEAGYPPFYKLIKIICKANDRNILERDSHELCRRLRNGGFNPLPPFEPYVKKRTKNYLKHIVLKENLNKDLDQLKNIVPPKYQIDVDPISIY